MTRERERLERRQGVDPALPRPLGERLCLDFANTVEAPFTAPRDYLTGYTALVRWGRHCGLLSSAQVERHLVDEARQPALAAETFERAIALRAAIQRTFAAIAGGVAPAEPDLATVQRAYLGGVSRARLMPRGERFDWEWIDDSVEGRVLWPVARSAIALLTTGDLARVKRCPVPDGCGWLFYDISKNASRRWCSMEGCGSHAKMRRYNARRRVARGGGESEANGDDGRSGAGDPLSGGYLQPEG